MLHHFYGWLLICGIIITASRTHATPTDDPEPNRSIIINIFKDPNDSHISEANSTLAPWVKTEYIPPIEDFYGKVMFYYFTSNEDFGIVISSSEARALFFKLGKAFLTEHNHPAATALANVLSKSASLFEKFYMNSYFEFIHVYISLGQFLVSRGVSIDINTAAGYVNSLENALDKGNISAETILQSFLVGYNDFVTSQGFNIDDVVNDLIILLSSQLIILDDYVQN